MRDGAFSSKLIDGEFDRNRLIQQELARDVARAVKMPFGEAPQTMPVPDGVSLLGWDADGKLANRPTEGASAAAAAASAAAAAAAAASINVKNVADRTAMLALSTAGNPLAIVKDDARGGEYDWLPGDQSALVTTDPGAIAVVPPVATPSGAGGVWLWRKMNRFNPRRAGALGALGDGSLDVVGGNPCPDDIVAMQRAMAWAAAEGAILEIDRPYRVGHTTRDENLFSNIGPGQLLTATNQVIEWLAEGWVYPCGYSRSGSIFTNLITQADPNSIQNNLRFINSQIDMSGYLPFRFTGQVVSADGLGTYNSSPATRVQLNTPLVGNPLPTGRGTFTFYNYACEIVSGTGAGQNAFIKGYDEANKRFTLNELWPIQPDATSVFRLGSNDNPYGFNVRDLQILGGLIRNVPLGVFGAGGKAINLENGPKDCIVADVKAENIQGVAFFVQGHPGVQTNGAKRWAQNITFENCSAEDCGALLAVLALDPVLDPDGSPVDNHVTMKNMWGKRVGHYPGRILASDHQKSAAVVLAEAGPTRLRDISVDNSSFVPDYSGLYPEQNGYGMSGPVGAVCIISGRGCDIDGLSAWGNFDNGFMIQRWRAGGDDASDDVTPSVVQNVYRNEVRNFFHSGVFTSEAGLPEAQRRTGFLVSMNPWIDTGSGYPGTTIRPADIEVRMRFRDIHINSDFELLPAHMASYTGIIFENVTDWLQKTQIEGPLSAARIYALGNTVASVKARTSSKTFRRTATLLHDVTSGGDVPAQGERDFTVSVPGVYLAENNSVYVTMSGSHLAGVIVRGEVTADGTVTVYVLNITSVAKTVGSRTYTVRVDTVIE
ncbi:MAG: hypothetical protein KUL88_04500 [Rhizobium sp.]|nr:hypothetical protein [Rhizobium sp.]